MTVLPFRNEDLFIFFCLCYALWYLMANSNWGWRTSVCGFTWLCLRRGLCLAQVVATGARAVTFLHRPCCLLLGRLAFPKELLMWRLGLMSRWNGIHFLCNSLVDVVRSGHGRRLQSSDYISVFSRPGYWSRDLRKCFSSDTAFSPWLPIPFPGFRGPNLCPRIPDLGWPLSFPPVRWESWGTWRGRIFPWDKALAKSSSPGWTSAKEKVLHASLSDYSFTLLAGAIKNSFRVFIVRI